MRLIYTGPHLEVVVDEFDADKVIARGEPVNFPDELGARLLEQDTWQEAADDQSAAGKARLAAEAAARADAQASIQAAAESQQQEQQGTDNSSTEGDS